LAVGSDESTSDPAHGPIEDQHDVRSRHSKGFQQSALGADLAGNIIE